MKKIVFGTLCMLLVSFLGLSQQTKQRAAASEPKIRWLTMEQAYAFNQTKPRKFMIDLYTDWCGWCKVMDKNTFTNAKVIDYVNKTYYAVKFNAEQAEDVTLGAKKYKFLPQAKAHELAVTFLNGQMSYPNIVFLDEKMGMIQPVPGYQEPAAFHKIIAFFGGNYYQKEQFEEFSKQTYLKLFP